MFPATIDLTTPGTRATRLTIAGVNIEFSPVAGIGDIDNDGFQDFLVGAFTSSPNGSSSGAAYVVYGRANLGTSIDLAALGAGTGFRIAGEGQNSQFGAGAAALGDINGDGFADFAVGSSNSVPSGTSNQTGATYVIFGRSADYSNFTASGSLGATGFKITGAGAGDQAFQVSAAGDFNGDGIRDFMVGAQSHDAGGSNSGAVYIIYGRTSGLANIDLASFSSANGVKITGIADSFFGASVSAAGDFNGDGFADIVVGAPGNDVGGTNRGAAYVIFGRASSAAISVGSMTASDGLIVNGNVNSAQFGFSVAGGGDFNRDGRPDIAFSGALGNIGSGQLSQTYLIYGRTTGGTINLDTLTNAQGVRIEGPDSANVGSSLALAGDVTGDGFADLVLAAYNEGNSGGFGGRGGAYIVYGTASAPTSVTLATMTSTQGSRIQGVSGNNYSGRFVGYAGDVNGDGGMDLLFAGHSSGGSSSNYIIYGEPAAVNAAPTLSGLAASVAYTEQAAAVLLDTDVTFADAEGNFTAGTLVVSGVAAGDTVAVSNQGSGAGQVGVSGATLSFGGTAIGTIAGGVAASLTITFNTSATSAAVDAVIQRLSYANSSDTPPASRALTVTVTDAGALSVTGGITVNITAVDDAPVAVPDAVTTAENATATGPLGALTAADTDVDGGPITIVSVNGIAGNVGTQITLASGALLTVQANGAYSYNPNGQFNYLVVAGSPTGGQSSATDSFTYALNGGSSATVTVTITGVTGAGDQIRGTPAANTLTGTPGNDLFFISQGGTDTVTTNGGSDTIFAGTTLDSSDRITGTAGAGIDNQVVIQGSYTATLTGPVLTNIQTLAIQPGNDARWGDSSGALYSYNITLADSANVAAGATLTVNANRLRVGENLVFNGAAETDGSFRFYAASGNDTLIGGGQADEFYGRLGADTLTGNGGNDTFFYRSAAESTQASRDTITDFTSGDRIDLSAIDANTLNAVGLNDAFTFIGAAAFSGGGITGAGQLRAVNTAGANWRIDGDIDGDGTADFSLIVMTTGGHAMVATDFIL